MKIYHVTLGNTQNLHDQFVLNILEFLHSKGYENLFITNRVQYFRFILNLFKNSFSREIFKIYLYSPVPWFSFLPQERLVYYFDPNYLEINRNQIEFIKKFFSISNLVILRNEENLPLLKSNGVKVDKKVYLEEVLISGELVPYEKYSANLAYQIPLKKKISILLDIENRECVLDYLETFRYLVDRYTLEIYFPISRRFLSSSNNFSSEFNFKNNNYFKLDDLSKESELYYESFVQDYMLVAKNFNLSNMVTFVSYWDFKDVKNRIIESSIFISEINDMFYPLVSISMGVKTFSNMNKLDGVSGHYLFFSKAPRNLYKEILAAEKVSFDFKRNQSFKNGFKIEKILKV